MAKALTRLSLFDRVMVGAWRRLSFVRWGGGEKRFRGSKSRATLQYSRRGRRHGSTFLDDYSRVVSCQPWCQRRSWECPQLWEGVLKSRK